MNRLLNEMEILTEPGTKKPSYSGVVLTERNSRILLDRIERDFGSMLPAGWQSWEPIAHHMTIRMGGLDVAEDLKSREWELVVHSIAFDGKVVAVGVDNIDAVPSKNANPHITALVNRVGGGKPFDSNKLDWSREIPVEPPLVLSGNVLDTIHVGEEKWWAEDLKSDRPWWRGLRSEVRIRNSNFKRINDVRKRIRLNESMLRRLVYKILIESSAQKHEFYHTTHKTHLESFIKRNIDPLRAKGPMLNQGPGFYVHSNRKDAIDHANNLSKYHKAEEVPDANPENMILVVMEAFLTPENFDADLEFVGGTSGYESYDLTSWFAKGIFEKDPYILNLIDRIVEKGGLISYSSRGNDMRGVTFRWSDNGRPERAIANRGSGNQMLTIHLTRWMQSNMPAEFEKYEISILTDLYDAGGAFRYHGPSIRAKRIEDINGKILWQG